MAYITTVYMKVKGIQTPHSVEELHRMRSENERVRKLRFVCVDNYLFEATPKYFNQVEAERQRNKRKQRQHKEKNTPNYKLVYYEDLAEDGISGEECIPDPSCNVEDIACHNLQIRELRKAMSSLSPKERRLIEATIMDGISVREYAAKAGIPRTTIQSRVDRIVAKLQNLMIP